MTFRVVFSREAEDSLERLFDHVDARELSHLAGDLDLPERAIDAIQSACQLLRVNPFTCRKAGRSGLVRELIIPFGATGCVAIFEIVNAQTVVIGAIRHQRENDFH